MSRLHSQISLYRMIVFAILSAVPGFSSVFRAVSTATGVN